MISKAVPIVKAFYPSYSFLFIFDNAISHVVYAEDALCTGGMNKNSEGKQTLIRDGWFENDNICHSQQMSYLTPDGTLIPKSIQRILEKKKLLA